MSRIIKTATNSYLVTIVGDKSKGIIEAIDLNAHVVYQYQHVVVLTGTAIDISFAYEIEIEKYSDHLRMTITNKKQYIGTFDLKHIVDMSAEVINNKIAECLALSIEKRSSHMLKQLTSDISEIEFKLSGMMVFILVVAIIQSLLLAIVISGSRKGYNC